MRAIVTFILLTAVRDRLFPGLAVLLSVTVSLGLFLGGTALNEQAETALTLAAGASRLTLALGIVVFIAFHVQRLFDNREIEALLARPLSRAVIALALACGYALVAVLPAAVIASLIALFAPDWSGFAPWALTLCLEAVLLALFALAAGLVFERAVPTTLASLGFYATARMMSFFTAIAAAETAGNSTGHAAMGKIVETVALLMPRLDLFARTAWLVDGAQASGWTTATVQALIYLPLLVVIAALDLGRKRL